MNFVYGQILLLYEISKSFLKYQFFCGNMVSRNLRTFLDTKISDIKILFKLLKKNENHAKGGTDYH